MTPVPVPGRAGGILLRAPLPADSVAALARLARVHDLSGPGNGAIPQDAAACRAICIVVTNGSIGLDAAAMAALPALGLILCTGAGYEGVDLAAARARGIVVANAPGTNDRTVADHALALMLAIARDLVFLDRAVRDGMWDSVRQARPTPSGATLGLLGYGRIGQAIAARARAFDMTILYHTRTPYPDPDARHVPDLADMARQADYLVVACPGGPRTRHLVNATVLCALGPGGFLVNVGRGSVVDTDALAAALLRGDIAGAALDVVEGEPAVPPALLETGRVILTPHLAGRSPQARLAQKALLENYVATYIQGGVLPDLAEQKAAT
ncbi:2-hydroxyacid dehydrogenase [Gluconacetobacter azotocaptans]|uniref:2-hydroxyacid dehydrogenase n=1 Tax=Gluconacetobacter azotocaptans TaxID=142834 RepID=A0A7W4JT66_9PROT|nr:NAD(P)-dependent oxidoreductase [Gluconacetobacter azotocaptans]MBB2190444.1 2-hydroxyacid dehydrogenase [Gluconacetobacter azotocaptans]GBQ30243.1 lactate dehydrogenase-like oxidoreductase [Gluconacetobacter azotocaptans DSM 13594]